jgi:hypothetical protein
MQEQAMVNDALNSINSGLKSLTDMIAQAENQELRQTLIKMRNEAETGQFELYTLAKSKNYYQPAQKATMDEIQNVKSFIMSNTMSQGGQMGQGGALDQGGVMGQGSTMNQGGALNQGSTMNQGMNQMSGQNQMR